MNVWLSTTELGFPHVIFGLKCIKSCAKKPATSATIVDAISGDMSIANFWRSKFEQLLNASRTHDADR